MKIKSSNYEYAPIGLRIKTARKSKGYTQEYIAEKMNVSTQHISDIERGLNGLSVPSLMDLCKVLEVSSDYILFGSNTADTGNPILMLLSKLSPHQRMFAEKILNEYVNSCGVE